MLRILNKIVTQATIRNCVLHPRYISAFPNFKLFNEMVVTNPYFSKDILRNKLLIRAFSNNIECWNCKTTNDKESVFFCSKCGSINKIDKSLNYFNLFGFTSKFDLDNAKLTSKFRELQSLLHPDKFSNKSQMEQENSLEWSSIVNKAYKTLSTPFNRGEYILKLQGYEIPESNTSFDKVFLTEMMERNEEVEDASTFEEIQTLLGKLRKDIDQSGSDLGKCLGANNLKDAVSILIKMKYLLSIEKVIKDKSLLLQK